MRLLCKYASLAMILISFQPLVMAFTAVSDFSLRRSNYPAARGLRHVVMMQGLCTEIQQPSSPATEIPEQFARSIRLARPAARLIPAEVNVPLTGFVTAMAWFAGARAAIAYVDPDDVGAVVSNDLPPVWVPLAVVAALVVGIGLLQGSLGDVMNDEAKLGGMSGARAAKQSARDRSMFKKKNGGS